MKRREISGFLRESRSVFTVTSSWRHWLPFWTTCTDQILEICVLSLSSLHHFVVQDPKRGLLRPDINHPEMICLCVENDIIPDLPRHSMLEVGSDSLKTLFYTFSELKKYTEYIADSTCCLSLSNELDAWCHVCWSPFCSFRLHLCPACASGASAS